MRKELIVMSKQSEPEVSHSDVVVGWLLDFGYEDVFKLDVPMDDFLSLEEVERE